MKCPYCNNDISDKSKVCEICGVELPKKINNVNAPSDKTINIALAVFLIITGLIAFGFGLALTLVTLGVVISGVYMIVGFSIVGVALMLYGLCYLLNAVSLFAGNDKFDDIIEKLTSIYSFLIPIGFYTFWFLFLLTADYQILTKPEENGGIQVFFFTWIFWAIGIFGLYSCFRKK